MNQPLRLISISENQYSDYRINVIFQAYKWDPQINDQNTIAKYALVIPRDTAAQLGRWAEQLTKETMLMEEALIHRLSSKSATFSAETKLSSVAKLSVLALPPQIQKILPRLSNYKNDQNVRLMRFDFHPAENTAEQQFPSGWAISEVNSDVPGGLAEASILPEIASRYVNALPGENVAAHLLKAFQAKIKKDGLCSEASSTRNGVSSTVAFVHATSYSDDRQVMQFLGDYFKDHGFKTIYAAPDHIKWINKKAVSIIDGKECDIDGIIRFYPLEWLVHLPNQNQWQGYYDCETPSCNNPAAIFAQSKRLPLIWDSLGIEIPAWKQFLPETCDPKIIKPDEEGWIYKPALGRVGEGISIKEAITKKELAQIQKAVRKNPKYWIAQRRFKSQPVKTETGESYHLCIGVFTVDGKNAGFYGRISPYPRIDSNAIDIPILIAGENDD